MTNYELNIWILLGAIPLVPLIRDLWDTWGWGRKQRKDWDDEIK